MRQMFLDDILTAYGEMETSFTKAIYRFYKAFEFRTLWDVSGKMVKFERTAAEAATGTGSLQGILQLTKAVQAIEALKNKVEKCFTKFPYSTDTHRWSFDTVKNPVVSTYVQAYIL